MIKAWIFLGVLALSVGFSSKAVAQEEASNTVCPVMKGEAVKKKFFVEHEGRKIYLCCRSCVKRFKKKPEKYIANLSFHSSPGR